MRALAAADRNLDGMDFVFGGPSDGKVVFNEKKGEKKKDVRITVAKIVVLVLAILLLAEGIFYTFIIPCLAPVKVQFSGLKNIKSSVLMEKLESMNTVTWIEFDSSKAVEALSTISGIETVGVDKIFPDKVHINIKERIPVAKTIIEIGRAHV